MSCHACGPEHYAYSEKMASYTLQEYTDMIIMYDEAREHNLAAARNDFLRSKDIPMYKLFSMCSTFGKWDQCCGLGNA